MAITVTTTPVTLSWSNFRTVPTLVDPADGEVIDAYTAFDFNFPSRPRVRSTGNSRWPTRW
jgi:hypothetical protein